MFERIIQFAIEQRIVVLLLVLAMAGVGVASYQKLPIDAVPDITNVQVQINTAAAGFSPLETEQRITFPIETAMAGLPHLKQTRSLSRSGFSQVTVIFADGTDLYFARQLVNEPLQIAREQLPEGAEAVMGPISTGLGEIFLWTVEAEEGAQKEDGTPYTPTDLRVIQDWIIKPQLRNVPGVAEINTIGGFAKEFQIAPDPKRLAAYKLTLVDLITALERRTVAGPRPRPSEQCRRHRQHRRCQRRRHADPHQPHRRCADRPRAAHRRRHGKRPRGGTRYRIHVDRREQPQRSPSRSRQAGRHQPLVAAGRDSDPRLRPYQLGGQSHLHGQEEPYRGGDPGDCHPLPVPRQHPCSHHHSHGDTAVDAVHVHRHVQQQGQRQPDELRRIGFRHHHRWCRGDC